MWGGLRHRSRLAGLMNVKLEGAGAPAPAPSRFCALAGHEGVKAMFRDQPVVEPLLQIYKPLLTALLETIVSFAEAETADGETDAGRKEGRARRILRLVFVLPGSPLQPFDRDGFATLPFSDGGEPFSDEDQQLAQHVGQIVGKQARRILDDCMAEQAERPDTIAPEFSQKSLQELLEKEAAAEDASGVEGPTADLLKRMTDSGYFELAEQIDKDAERYDNVPGYDADKAVFSQTAAEKILETLVNSVSANCVMANVYLADHLKSELERMPARLTVATALAGASTMAKSFGLSGSTRATGIYVHEILERRFITERKATSDVICELKKRGQTIPVLAACGRSTNGRKMQLSKMAGGRLDNEKFFTITQTALRKPNVGAERYWRADLIDRSLSMIWEIKPVGSAFYGVTQETVYRTLFNLRQIEYEMCLSISPIATRLVSGRSFYDQQLNDFTLNAPFDVSAKFNSPAIAFPFQTRSLNGVWPYTVIKIPKGISAVVALALAAQAAAHRELLDAISHLPQEMRTPARQWVGLPGQIFTELIVGIVCAVVLSALIQLVALAVIGVVAVAYGLFALSAIISEVLVFLAAAAAESGTAAAALTRTLLTSPVPRWILNFAPMQMGALVLHDVQFSGLHIEGLDEKSHAALIGQTEELVPLAMESFLAHAKIEYA